MGLFGSKKKPVKSDDVYTINDYIEDLYKKNDYINVKELKYVKNKVLSEGYYPEAYGDYYLLQQINVILSQYNGSITAQNNQDIRKEIADERDKFMEIVEENCTICKNKIYDHLQQLEKGYKTQVDDNSVSLEKDLMMYDILGLRHELDIIADECETKEDGIELASQQGLGVFMDYYYNYNEYNNLENELRLIEAYRDSVWMGEINYEGYSFVKEDAFAVDCNSYFDFMYRLKNYNDYFKDVDIDSPRFQEMKEYFGFTEENLTNLGLTQYIGDSVEVNKSILERISDTYINLNNFYLDMGFFMPRALFGSTDKFIITKEEVDSIINKSALENMPFNYEFVLDFLDHNNVKANIDPSEKDMFLYQCQVNEIPQEKILKVCRCKQDYQDVPLTFANISEEFTKALEEERENQEKQLER